MNRNSHKQIALYFAGIYLDAYPTACKRLFILGSLEPDANLSTYLKGSLRHQWLRGHNWENAQRYIRRLSQRLERRTHFRAIDFYMLGKLIHYTLDAFTYAHNSHFSGDLTQHRKYEKQLELFLQRHFEKIIFRHSESAETIFQTIRLYKTAYLTTAPGYIADALYCKTVCHAIFERLRIGCLPVPPCVTA